jgi:hypothetical protein
MDAKFDSNIELPPNMILIMAAILVVVAFGIVGTITLSDPPSQVTDPSPAASPAPAPQ